METNEEKDFEGFAVSRFAVKNAGVHFGFWLVEPKWMHATVESINAGLYSAQKFEEESYAINDGVAIISLTGIISKGNDYWGGTSSVSARNQIRAAVNDEAVKGIMLLVDSPGGTVAGTADLASDVKVAGKSKPVHAHIDNLGASAAYWVASQAGSISAAPTAEVGSIGTVAVVADCSGMAEKKGIKVHVISTGKHKGAFTPGAPVDEEQIADLKARVEDLNGFFLAGVLEGRGDKLSEKKLAAIADGRVFIASKAKESGLIDRVKSFDAALVAMQKGICENERERSKKGARAHVLTRLMAAQIELRQ